MILTKSYPSTRNFTNVFDELFNNTPASWDNGARSNSSVRVNIQDTEKGYELEFLAPGRNKEDFRIDVDKNLLTISYEKKDETEAKDQKFLRREFVFNSFKRSFSLDEKINAENIEARYENGVLKVFLPKKEEVKAAPKQIAIQ